MSAGPEVSFERPSRELTTAWAFAQHVARRLRDKGEANAREFAEDLVRNFFRKPRQMSQAEFKQIVLDRAGLAER